LLPGSEESIFLGGLDRAFSGDWQLLPEEEDLFRYMDASMSRGSVVLVQPRDLGLMMPGMLTDIYPVDPWGKMGEGERREDATAFAEGELSRDQLGPVVDRHGVDYIVVREVDAANKSVWLFSRAQWLAEIGPFEVYQIVP
jgi:hypothetical protein